MSNPPQETNIFKPHINVELIRAQEAHDKASEEDRRLQKEIEDTNRKLGMDYGKDEAFAQLADQCFDYKDAE